MDKIRIVKHHYLLQHTWSGSNKFYELVVFANIQSDGSLGVDHTMIRYGPNSVLHRTGGGRVDVRHHEGVDDARRRVIEKQDRGYRLVPAPARPVGDGEYRYLWPAAYEAEVVQVRKRQARAANLAAVQAAVTAAGPVTGGGQLFD